MKVALLEQRHPDHDGQALAVARALYAGGRRWHALRETWLPKHPEEALETHRERLARALYHNHVGPITDMLGAAVFTEPPAVDGLKGEWLADWLGNVDREGTALGAWCRERLVDALVERKVFAWINLPARDPAAPTPVSRADETNAGLLSAFLVAFTAEQVIDWEVDGDGRLAWLMIRDVVEQRASVDVQRTQVHRWTCIDRTSIRRWTWSSTTNQSAPTAEAEADEQPVVKHGLGELPVACLELPEGLYALGKLTDPAIAHIRARNDLSWALHRGAHPLLYIKAKWGETKRPVLGPGYYLSLDPDDGIGYAETSGASHKLLAEDTVQLREELYRVVHQMAVGADSDASRARSSGESKQADWKAMEIVLSALAEKVRGFMVDVLRLVARARGDQTARPSITGLDGWQEEDLEVWLAAAAMATDAHQLSATFRKEVAKRQAKRVLVGASEEVLEAVRTEIDAAQVDTDPAPYIPPPRGGRLQPDPADEDQADPADE